MITDRQFKELLGRFDELEAKYTKLSQDMTAVQMKLETVKKKRDDRPHVRKKDVTRYVFMGKLLNKRQLVLECVKQYVADAKITSFDVFKEVFPDHIQGPLGVLRKKEGALHYKDAQSRYFFEENNEIHLDDGTYVISKEWNVKNIDGFVDIMETLGYKIDLIIR